MGEQAQRVATIEIDGHQATVPESMTAEDFNRMMGNDTGDKTLVLQNQDGTYKQIPNGQRIRPKNGDMFSTIINRTGG